MCYHKRAHDTKILVHTKFCLRILSTYSKEVYKRTMKIFVFRELRTSCDPKLK